MTRVNPSIKEREPITPKEFQEVLANAAKIKDEYFRLRALAVLSLLRLTGKRREEIANIPRGNFKVENNFLHVTFKLEKKKRKIKICPACQTRNSKASKFCKNCGANLEGVEKKVTSKPSDARKSIPLSDPLARNILDYLELLDATAPNSRFWLPTGKCVFGNYFLQTDEHLTGRSVFNIVRDVTKRIWPHLFRETAAADIVRADPTLTAVFKVQRRLDLESYDVAFNYLKRYASDVIERERKETLEADQG
jgi:integrase